MVSEALEMSESFELTEDAEVQTKLAEVVDERIDEIATFANVSVSQLTAVVRYRAPDSSTLRRKLGWQPPVKVKFDHDLFPKPRGATSTYDPNVVSNADLSNCNQSRTLVFIEIVYESNVEYERDAFSAAMLALALQALATGTGFEAGVCAVAKVIDEGRVIVPAPYPPTPPPLPPRPPPNPPPQPASPPSAFNRPLVLGAIAGSLLLLFLAFVVIYYCIITICWPWAGGAAELVPLAPKPKPAPPPASRAQWGMPARRL